MNIPRHLVGPLALVLAMVVAPAASASASTCQAQWGSLVKKRFPSSSEPVTDVRSGRNRCFDRLVVDLGARGDGRPGYRVGYVKRVVMDGSGTKVPLRGGARLQVIVKAPAYDDNGAPTYRPGNANELVDVSGYRTFRQVAWAGSFEGWTTIGLGVRARLPMRAFVLADADGGHRVVVDVAHRWY